MTPHERAMAAAPDRVPGRPTLAIAASALFVFALSMVIAWLLTPGDALHLARTPGGETISGAERSLIETESVGRERHRQARRQLERWEWADRETGRVRPPIERAMEWVIENSEPSAGPQ
jgi:hypothetical protein